MRPFNVTRISIVFLICFVFPIHAVWTQEMGSSANNPNVAVASAVDLSATARQQAYSWEVAIQPVAGNYFYLDIVNAQYSSFMKVDKTCGQNIWWKNPSQYVFPTYTQLMDDMAVIGTSFYSAVHNTFDGIRLIEIADLNGAYINNYVLVPVGGIGCNGASEVLTVDGTRLILGVGGYCVSSLSARVVVFDTVSKTIVGSISHVTDGVDEGVINAKPAVYGSQILYVVEPGNGNLGPEGVPATLKSWTAGNAAPNWVKPLNDGTMVTQTSQILVVGTRVIVSRYSKLSAFDLTNSGNPLWGPFSSRGITMVANGNTIYTSASDGIRSVDATNGNVNWFNSVTRCSSRMTYLSGPNELMCVGLSAGVIKARRISVADGSVIADSAMTFSSTGNYDFPVLSDGTAVMHGGGGLTLLGNDPALNTITVTPATASVQVNAQRQFTASCTNACGIAVTCPALTWSVSPVTLGTVSTTGLFTAASIMGAGSVIATAQSITGSSAVTVTGLTTCSVCTGVNQCAAPGVCRVTLGGVNSRCAPDATSCVLNSASPCSVATGTYLCSGNNFNNLCTNGVWGPQNNCDTTPDTQAYNPPGETPALHPPASNACGWQSQAADSCTSTGGCTPPAMGNNNCGSYIASSPAYTACASSVLANCDQGCLAACDENSDCNGAPNCVGNIRYTYPGTCSAACACSTTSTPDPSCQNSYNLCGAECYQDSQCGTYSDGCLADPSNIYRDYSAAQGICDTTATSCACVPPTISDSCIMGSCGAQCDATMSQCMAFANPVCSTGTNCVCKYKPVAVVGGPYTEIIGTPHVISSAGSNDPDGSIPATGYIWTLSNSAGCNWSPLPTGANPSLTCSTTGTRTYTLRVRDNEGFVSNNLASSSITFNAPANSPPEVTGGTFFGNINQEIVVSGTVKDDVSVIAAGTEWTLDPATTDCTLVPGSPTFVPALPSLPGVSVTATARFTCTSNGNFQIKLTANDGSSTASAFGNLMVGDYIVILDGDRQYYADDYPRDQPLTTECHHADGTPFTCSGAVHWYLKGFAQMPAGDWQEFGGYNELSFISSIYLTPNGFSANFHHETPDSTTSDGEIKVEIGTATGTKSVHAPAYQMFFTPLSASLGYGDTADFTVTSCETIEPTPVTFTPCPPIPIPPGSVAWSVDRTLPLPQPNVLGLLTPINPTTVRYTAPSTDVVDQLIGRVGIAEGSALITVIGVAPPPIPPVPIPPAGQPASILLLSCPRLTATNQTNVTLQCLNISSGGACDSAQISLSGAPNVLWGPDGSIGFIYTVDTRIEGDYNLLATVAGIGSSGCRMSRVGVGASSVPDLPVSFVLLSALAALFVARHSGRKARAQ